jgi:hypothetical protein
MTCTDPRINHCFLLAEEGEGGEEEGEQEGA